MAHSLRYYKEITHADGKVIRIEFHEKGEVASAMELGNVIQHLALEIQGGSEIDEPIIKTQLNFTLVDAPDHKDRKTKKCGAWEEFYSPDATHWKVLVFADGKQIWGGYITPDSYHEILTYHSGVSFVARDNIGHLQDFPFDAKGNADGMITLLELVREAWDKIESPMVLNDQAIADAHWMLSDGVYAYDTYMNISAFEDMNWLEALESTLYAYGLVLRYMGNNEVVFYPLRNLPEQGFNGYTEFTPVFEVGAERELTPAAKRIEETAKYENESVFINPPTADDFLGSTIEVGTYKRQLWPLTNTQQGSGWANTDRNATLFVNPKAYGFLDGFMIDEDKENIYNEIYLNGGIDGDIEYSQEINARNCSIELNLGRMILFEKDFSSASSNWQIASAINSRINAVSYSVSISKNGITKWLQTDGSWAAGKTLLTQAKGEEATISSMVVALNLEEFVGSALLAFHINSIQINQNNSQYCVSLLGLRFISRDNLCERNNVNTNYNESNNVILSREPKIAPALNTPTIPQIIKNGIFVKENNTYNSARTWYWGGQTPQQMAVYNHLQLLCYHGKPCNILSGTIVNGDIAQFARVYRWKGVEHILISGVLNLLNGYIQDAQLREFVRYENLWGDLTDAADFPEVEGGVDTTASGAGTGNAATYTNTTEVRIGGSGGTIVLDTFMSDTSENGVMNRVIKAYVDNLWHLDESGNIVTDKQVLIKNSLIVEQDTSSGGEGESVLVGVQGISVNGGAVVYPNSEGIVELTISGGGGGGTADLSNYYTKAQSDARYLALNGGGQVVGSTDTPLYLKSGVSNSYIGFKNSSDSILGYYGFRGTTPIVYSGESSAYYLIHSGNIGNYAPIYNANGNVLIGPTTDLGYKLDISGNVRITNSLELGAGRLDKYTLYSQVSGFKLIDKDNVERLGLYSYDKSCFIENLYGGVENCGIQFFDSGKIRLFGGNVGIGTDSPSTKLDVNGDIATNQYLRVKAWAGYGSGSCDMWYNGNTTSLNMGCRLKMAYGLTIDSEGASITGAVTMSSTLSVSGNITCSSNLIVSGDVASA